MKNRLVPLLALFVIPCMVHSAHPKEVMKEDEEARQQVKRQRELEEFQRLREQEDLERRKKKGVLPEQLAVEAGSAAAVQSLGGPEEEELQQAIAMSLESQEKPARTKKTAKAQEERKEDDEKQRAEEMQTYRKNLAEAEREQAAARARRGGRPAEYSKADVTKLVGAAPTAVGKYMKQFMFKGASFLGRGVQIELNSIEVQGRSRYFVVSKDSKFILLPYLEKIYVWDIYTRSLIGIFGHAPSGDFISHLAISKDGKRIVAAGHRLHVWDVQSRQLLHTFSFKNFFTVAYEYVSATAINDDGSVIAIGTSQGRIHVWNVDTQTLQRSFSTDKNQDILWLAINKEGNRIIAGQMHNSDAYMWDVQTGNLVHKFVGHRSTVSSVSIGFEQDFIITGSWDGTARIWNAKTGDVVGTLDVKGIINAVSVAANNELIVIACRTGEIYLWDGMSSTPQRKLKVPGSIWSATMSNDGKWIIAAAQDDAKIYTIKLKEPEEEKLELYARRAHFIDEAEKLRNRASLIRQFSANRLQAINKGIALLKSADITRNDLEEHLGKIESRIKQEFDQGLQERIEYVKSVRERANRTQDFPDEFEEAIRARVERLLKEDQSQPDFAGRVNEAVQEVERLLEEGLEEIRRQNLLAPPFGF